MTNINKVTLLGANGNLGPAILQALHDARFVITVLRRSSSTSTSTHYPPNVQVTEVPDEFVAEDVVDCLRGQDAVIACIHGSQTAVQQQLARAAAMAGVSRFIPADFGSCDSQSSLTQELVPLYKRKTEMREYLQDLTKHYPDFSWTSLVPGHFFDWSLHFVHIFLADHRADVLDEGETKFSISTLARVGEATARVLQEPEQTRNQILYVQSFRVTQRQVIAAYERATGVTWQVTSIDAKTFQSQQKAKADAGSSDATEELVWLLGTIDADWTVRDGFAMDLLGLQDENLDQVVQRIVTTFNKQSLHQDDI